MEEPWATAALLAACGLLLLLAGLASPLSGRLGVPALVFFVALGILAGSEGIGGIPFDDFETAYTLGTLALVLILFDGGLNTPISVLRRAWARASLLATVAVVITAAVVAVAAMGLGLSPLSAALVGAVVSSTDAAAVFSVLRNSGLRLRTSTAATLEVESGINDPMAVLLTAAVTGIALGEVEIGWGLAGMFVSQLLVGLVGGLSFGLVGRLVLRILVLPAAGLYPVLTVALALLAYGGTTVAGGSGFLAVYLAAIVVSHGPMPYRAGIRRVHDSMAWLAQILMFVLLGLLVFPSRLVPNADEGLALAAVLAFLARPL
ncbi:partial K(+)/H(+) antiporter NhaP, partial [Myxococcaceae bacterium]